MKNMKIKIAVRVRWLINDAEYAAILNKIMDHDVRDFVEILNHTGMRLMELLNLEWDEVDLKKSEITINPMKVKSMAPLRYFLNRNAIKILRRRWESSDRKRVFDNLTICKASYCFKKAITKHGHKGC